MNDAKKSNVSSSFRNVLNNCKNLLNIISRLNKIAPIMMLKICFLLVGYFTLAICIRPENSAPTTVDSNEITALELMNYNESRNFIWNSDLPDRIQWSHNYGYCGGVFFSAVVYCLLYVECCMLFVTCFRSMFFFNTEVSMIMACLKYGQYFSQYDVRDIAVVYPGDNKQSGGHWWVIFLFSYIQYTF